MTAGVASVKFAIYGVPNGEYEIFAFRSNESNDRTSSLPRRLIVRGADVGGIESTCTGGGAASSALTIAAVPGARARAVLSSVGCAWTRTGAAEGPGSAVRDLIGPLRGVLERRRGPRVGARSISGSRARESGPARQFAAPARR